MACQRIFIKGAFGVDFGVDFMLTNFKVYGNMELCLRDQNDNIKEVIRVFNTVTTNGKYGVMDQILASPTLGKMTHLAIGTGTPSSTALGSELDRKAFLTKTRANAVVTVTGYWGPGEGTGDITEAGTFDASSSGNMWMSASFSTVSKLVTDTLTITWTLTGA